MKGVVPLDHAAIEQFAYAFTLEEHSPTVIHIGPHKGQHRVKSVTPTRAYPEVGDIIVNVQSITLFNRSLREERFGSLPTKLAQRFALRIYRLLQ